MSFTISLSGVTVRALDGEGEALGDLDLSRFFGPSFLVLRGEGETLGDLARFLSGSGGAGDLDRFLSGSGGGGRAGGVGGFCGGPGSDHGTDTLGHGSRVLDEYCVATAEAIVDASSWPFLCPLAVIRCCCNL